MSYTRLSHSAQRSKTWNDSHLESSVRHLKSHTYSIYHRPVLVTASDYSHVRPCHENIVIPVCFVQYSYALTQTLFNDAFKNKNIFLFLSECCFRHEINAPLHDERVASERDCCGYA